MGEIKLTGKLMRAEQLQDKERIFPLTPEDFKRLNPNTKTCPIFRTRADAELTRRIYERVPVLINEETGANPWDISFKRMFDMATDSHVFRTAEQLEAEGYRADGNAFASPFDRYLPLYEAKMLHQFDHRWCTYVDAEETRDLTPQEKSDRSFVVRPRYWVREEIVNSAAPHYPEELNLALTMKDAECVGRILMLVSAT